MPCDNLDSGPVPNRDPFARFWRDTITELSDLLPKADGLANGEEGTYPEAPYQANYIKSLRRRSENEGDDVDPDAYCDYLGILRGAREQESNEFEDICLQGGRCKDDPPAVRDCGSVLPEPLMGGATPRLQTNPQGGLPVTTSGPEQSGINLNLFRTPARSMRPAPRIDGAVPVPEPDPDPQPVLTREHENTAEAVELYWMALLRDLPFRRWTLPAPGNWLPNANTDWKQLQEDGATIERAVEDLNYVRDYFAEPYPVQGGDGTVDVVRVGNIFRGAAFGDRPGPYISQFLLRGNTVRCARGTRVRHFPNEGVILEGSVPNLQRQVTVVPYVDFLRRVDEWRCVEQGLVDPSGTDPIECEETDIKGKAVGKVGRFIRNLRDLGNWVHLDDPAQHFRNAALLMLSEPELGPAQATVEKPAPRGRTALDSFRFSARGSNVRDAAPGAGADRCRPAGNPFGFSLCNPYVEEENPEAGQPNTDADTQSGFVTFGPEHVLDAIGEVTDLALRAAWWQKWYVHRRLRPEEFGGLVDGQLRQGRPYQVDELLKQFRTTPEELEAGRPKRLLNLIEKRNQFPDVAFRSEDGSVPEAGRIPGQGTYLLPQLFPEGSPTHPAYPSGHATISGACATLLKAFFDTERPMTCPDALADPPDPTRLPPAFVASDDGLKLERAPGSEAEAPLTVGGELDKLASNISIGRNAAGVHWRSDATQGMELGEAVATYFLYEQAWALNEEEFCFSFRRFFRPEMVTISRTTEYRPGTEARTVTWCVQPLDENGTPSGAPESLARTRTLNRP